MWLFLALISMLMQGLVNYIDEFLTNNNSVSQKTGKQTKIGGLVIISTLMSFAGAGLMLLIPHDPTLTKQAFWLAFASAIPMVGMYVSYFYLLLTYPVHLVGPLFQISSIWLLLFEILGGERVSAIGVIGILIMIYGAYVLDTNSLKWKVPTKLLLYTIPATSTWALAMYMVRIASSGGSAIAISVWQMIGIGFIGTLLFILVKQYREGFLYRVKNQGKVFLGLSLVNESLAEGSFMFGNMAVAIAPVAAYVTAMAGVQSIFVLMLFVMFPQGERTRITKMQWVAVVMIAFGLLMINLATM